MKALFDAITAACRERSWCWELEYSEVENTFYATAGWSGAGESVEVKRCADPEDCLKMLLQKIVEWRIRE